MFLFRDKERCSTIPDPAYDFPGHDVLLSARRRHRYEAHPRDGMIQNGDLLKRDTSHRRPGNDRENRHSLPVINSGGSGRAFSVHQV